MMVVVAVQQLSLLLFLAFVVLSECVGGAAFTVTGPPIKFELSPFNNGRSGRQKLLFGLTILQHNTNQTKACKGDCSLVYRAAVVEIVVTSRQSNGFREGPRERERERDDDDTADAKARTPQKAKMPQ